MHPVVHFLTRSLRTRCRYEYRVFHGDGENNEPLEVISTPEAHIDPTRTHEKDRAGIHARPLKCLCPAGSRCSETGSPTMVYWTSAVRGGGLCRSPKPKCSAIIVKRSRHSDTLWVKLLLRHLQGPNGNLPHSGTYILQVRAVDPAGNKDIEFVEGTPGLT